MTSRPAWSEPHAGGKIAHTLLLDPRRQPQFVSPLPVPAVARPVAPGAAHYELAVTQFRQDVGLLDVRTGQPLLTTLWGYGGSFPGPTFEARRDAPITVRWTNDLVDNGRALPSLLPVDTSIHWADPKGWPVGGVPVVTHLHGGHTEPESDGYPDAWFTPGFAACGEDFVKETYAYANDQRAATIWYHDHALGMTRLNVCAGLAGFYLLRDEWESSLGLPDGQYEIPLMIQDRMFFEDGSLAYPAQSDEASAPYPSVLPEFFGDFILVNGKTWPLLDVEPRKYRLRMLNASDSRFYRLFFSPQLAFHQIGSDGGLLDAPVRVNRLLLSPAERADVVVDFSLPHLRGRTLILRNDARSPYPNGDAPDPRTAGRVMAFRIGGQPALDSSVLPDRLRPEPIARLVPDAPVRELLLGEGKDEFGRLKALLGTARDGLLTWHDPITETPALGSVEAWDIYNTTPDTHPVHLHLVHFQVVHRQKFKAQVDKASSRLVNIRRMGLPRPPPPSEAGWKDTVRMNPGEVTRIVARFDKPGRYVWHCHILSHEDHEMMRPFHVGPTAP
jgi:spore coat protein A